MLILGLLAPPFSYAELPSKASYGPVTSSDTLGQIVSRHYSGSELSSQQIMIGILRANPESFIGGNIHFLLRGSTLQLPSENRISTIKKNDAIKIINEHLQYFKRGKTGNLTIAPLDGINTSADISDFEKDATSILSRSTDNNQLEENTPIVEEASPKTIVIKQEATKTASNTIKDIELESLKIKITQLEKILSRRGLSSSASDNDTTTDQISKELKSTLNTQKEKIDLLEEERENKNKELAHLKTKIIELESSLKKISESLSNNNNQPVTTDDKDTLINQLKERNTNLEKKLTILQAELDKKTEEVVTLTNKIRASKKQIGVLESKISDSNKENSKLDQQIAALEEKLASIRQEPARNLGINNSSNDPSSFGISPWIWLLPALFLLSILAYLFKRSFSQPKKIAFEESNTTYSSKTHNETNDEQTHQKTAKVAAAISAVPDIVSSASEEESVEASIKLDIGKAYLDMDMPDAAIEILQEAYEEGSEKQRLDAKNLLKKLT
jgi:FimV-like protein